jgi:hypothetical protein
MLRLSVVPAVIASGAKRSRDVPYQARTRRRSGQSADVTTAGLLRSARNDGLGYFTRFSQSIRLFASGDLGAQLQGKAAMKRLEKMRRNIEELKDSLLVDWSDLAASPSPPQRVEIEAHLQWCLAEMSWRLAQMRTLSETLREPRED